MLKDFLAGVRVIDLSQFLPGSFAPQLLADLRAEVLQVEPPPGHPPRRFHPISGPPCSGTRRPPSSPPRVSSDRSAVGVDC